MESSDGQPFSSFELTPDEVRAEKSERGAVWSDFDKPELKMIQALRWKDINSLKFPDIPWRIKNLVPLQGLVIISGVSGGGKSWLALEMARSICAGEDFLGQREFACKKGKVLYVDSENPKSEIQRRGRQLGFGEDDDFSVVSMDNLDLRDEIQFMDFKTLVQHGGFDTVFVDTMRAVAGGMKEEKAEEVRGFFNRFRVFKDEGVAVIFLDHTRKPSHFDGKIPKKEFLLGSVDKVASIEVLLMLQSEPGSPEINVFQRKNRSSKEISPFQIVMMDEMVGESTRTQFTYNGELLDEANKKEEAKELALDLLSSVEGLTSKEILSETQKQVGQKNMRAALKELAAEGLLDVGRNGKQNYYMLPKGRETPESSLAKDELEEIFDSI